MVQPLDQAITVRLPATARTALAAEALLVRRTPAALARTWILDRLGMDDAGAAPEATRPRSRAASSQERLRAEYRPDDVVVLMVGESAPAGGTFFYQADSNLYRATREAFARTFGSVPEGPAFLDYFRGHGFWLWDFAEVPVNRMPGRPRQQLVDRRMTALAGLIRELEPDFVIAIKATLEGPVQRAVQLAGFPPRRVRVLPFPVRQWRPTYVRDLARFLGEVPAASDVQPGSLSPDAERLTLHEAMQIVLADYRGSTMTAREIANEVAARGLYERRDGGRADQGQVLLRARNYPGVFVVGGRGIRLADGQ